MLSFPGSFSFQGFPGLAIKSPFPPSLPSFTFHEGMSLLKCLCRLTNFSASFLICRFYSFSRSLYIFWWLSPV